MIGLAVIALLGIIFPLVHIHIHLLGTTTMSLRVLDMFGNLGSEVPQEALDFAISDELAMSIALPIIAYFLAFFLTITTLVLAFTDKLKILKIVFVSIAMTLMIYAGASITSLPNTLSNYLGDFIADLFGDLAGLFASLLDLSNILEINLGAGYWITLIMLLVMLILLIVTKIIEYTQKKVSAD